jgi:hypothetical protein
MGYTHFKSCPERLIKGNTSLYPAAINWGKTFATMSNTAIKRIE